MKNFINIFKNSSSEATSPTLKPSVLTTIDNGSVSGGESDFESYSPLSSSFDKTTIDNRALRDIEYFYRVVIDFVKQKEPKSTQYRISKHDLETLLSPQLISPKLLDKIYHVYVPQTSVDSGVDKKIEVKTFFAGLSACCMGSTDQKLKFCFKLYDDDNDDKLSYTELKTMMNVLFKLNEIQNKLMRSTSTLQTFSRSARPADDYDEEDTKKSLVDINIIPASPSLVNNDDNGGECEVTKRLHDSENSLKETPNVSSSLPDIQSSPMSRNSKFDELNKKLRVKISDEVCPSDDAVSEYEVPLYYDQRRQSYPEAFSEIEELTNALFQGLNLGVKDEVGYNEYLRWIHKHPYYVAFLDRIKSIAVKMSKKQQARHLASEERDLISPLFNNLKLNVGDNAYLISSRWWRVWCDYVGYDRNFPDNYEDEVIFYPPGPIDNSDISLQESKLDELTEFAQFPLLRENLFENADYIVVNETIWTHFYSWYGGGPVFIRTVLKNVSLDGRRISTLDSLSRIIPEKVRQGYNLDLYPLLLGLGYLKDRKIIGRCFCSFETSATELKELACKQLNIPYQNQLRLYAQYPETEPVLLADESKTLKELGITPGYIILVDANPKHSRSGSAVLPKWLYKTHVKSPSTVTNHLTVGGGIVGFQNLGNTCFLNAALQCLTHTAPLVQYFLEDVYKSDLNLMESDGKFTNEFAILIKNVWKARPFSYLAPQALRLALISRASQFGGNEQHDSQEALGLMLDFLHNELNLVKKKISKENPDYSGQPDDEIAAIYWENHLIRDSSLIVALFEGQFKSHCVCLTCRHEIIKYHPFMFLSLPLPENHTVVLTVTVLWCKNDRLPITFKVRMEKSSLVSLISDSIHSTLGVEVLDKNFIIAEVSNSYVYQFLALNRRVSEITEKGGIYVYEIDTNSDEVLTEISELSDRANSSLYQSDESEELSDDSSEEKQDIKVRPPLKVQTQLVQVTKNLVLLHRNTKLDWSFIGRKPKNILFGSPFITMYRTSGSISGKRIYEIVLERIKRIFPVASLLKEQLSSSTKSLNKVSPVIPSTPDVDNGIDIKRQRPSSNSSKYTIYWPFTLKFVNNNGTQCTKCNLNTCTGCIVEFSDHPVEMNVTEVLAIEWNLKKSKISKESIQKIFSTFEIHPSYHEVNNSNDRMLTLSEIMQEYEKAEWMSENDYYCPKCKANRQGIKRETIWRLPPILMIQFKRFSYTAYGCVKNDMMISVPLANLNMSPFLTEKAEGDKKNLLELQSYLKQDNSHKPFPINIGNSEAENKYDLFAVISHLGSFYDGHYITHAKDSIRGNWYCFNDHECKEWVPSSDDLNSYSAYVIFYQRHDIPALDSLRAETKNTLEEIMRRL